MIDQKRLIQLYKDYSNFASLRWPDWRKAIDFAVTEIGYVVGARLRSEPGWVRHVERDMSLGEEITQAIMMLIIAADELGVDVEKTTMAWMKKRGFNAIYWSGKDYTNWGDATSNSTMLHLWGKFEGYFQSACGLEMPEEKDLYRVFFIAPIGERLCKECQRYFEARHGYPPDQPRIIQAQKDYERDQKSRTWQQRMNARMRRIVGRKQRK